MPPPQASLLFTIGTDAGVEITEAGKPRYAGCTDLHRLFNKREPVHLLQVTSNALRPRRRPELEPYRCILNLITDPDQNPRTLDNLKKLLRGYGGQVLNRPEAVMRSTRDQVARRLEGIAGLLVPKVLRLRNARPQLVLSAIERAGLDYPLIVRQAGTHTGKILGLFANPDELAAALGDQGELIVTEFVDFQSPDGLYRKYRAMFIGRRFIFRHMLVSDSWNVHARDRMRFMAERPELLAEEASLFAAADRPFLPQQMETLEAIRQRMGLDYFGMDFGQMPDGRLLLFEANPTMNFYPFLADPRFEYVKQCHEPARQAFHEMLGCRSASFAPIDVQLSL